MMRIILIAVFALLLSSCGTSFHWEFGEQDDAVATVSEKALPERGPGQIVAESLASDWQDIDPKNTLYIDIPQGRIVVALSPDLAAGHVAQVKKLAREGYYDGLHFYRVIEGFVAQGGDESSTREIKTALKNMLPEFDETWRNDLAFTPLGNQDGYADAAGYLNGFPAARDMNEGKVWLTHCTGAFAFGRNTPKDSASTEFYIALQPQRYLDRNLTVFGRVVWGMEHVQAIKRGKPGNGGTIEDKARWTKITAFQVAADVPENERFALEQLNTNTETFKELIRARRNRPEDFFYFRPDYLDLCQLALPVRIKK